jgi:hypothetical protein
MKLFIELDDTEMNRTIQAQVSAAIASMTTKVIDEQVQKILEIKFGRVTDAIVLAAINDAATKAVNKAVTSGYGSNTINAILANAALKLMKSQASAFS